MVAVTMQAHKMNQPGTCIWVIQYKNIIIMHVMSQKSVVLTHESHGEKSCDGQKVRAQHARILRCCKLILFYLTFIILFLLINIFKITVC